VELKEAIERVKQTRSYLLSLDLPSANKEAEALTVLLNEQERKKT
jgi:hypothetical protein